MRPSATSRRILGGGGDDTITLGSAIAASDSIDLSSGNDKLVLTGACDNTGSVSNVETLVGGSGADTITFTTQLSNGSVDLGAGTDSLTLSSAVNTVTVSTSRASSAALTTTPLRSAPSRRMRRSISTAGSDKLTLGNFANVVTITNVETLVGGTGDDTLTLGTVFGPSNSINLGAGVDSLTLADAANKGTIANVETIIGGSAADTITLGSATAKRQRSTSAAAPTS